jgi:lantibiotic biosynthesis protein
VTPAVPARKGTDRRRSGSRDGGLYEPLGWALVRAPLLAAGAAAAAGAATSGGSLLPGDPRVRAAIDVASTDLAAALARTRPGDPRAARVRGKLLRYLIRMSTRPTPYGLFAGVGLVGWGAGTDVALAPASPSTRTRPDMEWLLELVGNLEQDPGIRSGLRLVASSAVVVRGGRAFSTSGSGQAVSVRATGAVRRALELARVPVTRATVAEELGGAPGATPEKVERLLDELLGQGFLRFDLRPPLTGGDPAGHVLGRLEAVPAARAAADGLAELRKLLAEWDGLALEERVEGWPGLLDRVRGLHPAASSKNLLQTDMALPMAGTRIHAAVGAEAARAAELLLRLSPFPDGPTHLDAYRREFEGRYGPDREIPLLELLDPDFGLGPPRHAGGDGIDQRVAARRDQLLRDLALDAHRQRRPVVELDDGLLGRLETWTPDATTAPPSLDVSVFVAASSPAAIDAGDFQVVVGPNLGAGAAGRNLGRFADLLGPRAREALAELSRAEAALAPGRILAEVVYLPEQARYANVAVRPAVHAREIVVDTPPGVPGEHVVPVSELVVGVRDGRLTVRWPAGGGEVVGVQGHMLNALQAPAAARFLLDVARGRRCQYSPFDWGVAAAFPFLPRVQRGRIVLALARWRIDPAAGELAPEPADSFADALAAWRERWLVPRRVYLAIADNRLLLDLDDPEHVELLREELRGLPEGHAGLLQEALPGPAEAWLPGADGGRIAELVVPVTLRQPGAPVAAAEPARAPAGPVPTGVRLRPPGSDWLYLKLYGPRPFEDELIAGPLASFGEFATGAGLSDGWFFLRYADPDSHLRVRFHGEPAALLGPLLQQVCDWAGELVADGPCTRFALDTYEREVERYGGEDGMLAAEAIFVADSPAVAGLLRLSREGALTPDRTALAVLSIDDLLQSLGLDAELRAQVYRDAAPPARHDGEEYRRRKAELRQLLGRAEPVAQSPGDDALAELLRARRSALGPAAALLGSLERDGRLDRSRGQLCRSYIHLHANRLLGTDLQHERLVLQLLRRTREGLNRAPVA